MTLYIGLMSGTSMDGIDAALVEMPANTLIYGITKKYSENVQNRLELVLKGTLNLASLCQLNTLIGKEFGLAAKDLLQQAQVLPNKIAAIGSHGQTICHDTTAAIPYTWQLGCGHAISAATGIKVVADFRTRDLINGGQGAPFAPLYHQQLFAHFNKNIAVVNIGGIANISIIGADYPTRGWDIGPGNCLLDAWIKKNQNKAFDNQGAWARSGRIISELHDNLLTDAFFQLKAPKSIGKEYFSIDWLTKYLLPEYKPADIQATLVAITAHSIVQTILANKKNIDHLYLCGGGTHNAFLCELLAHLLQDIPVQSCTEIGISSDYIEAMMCAWLAFQTVNNKAVDLSAITGASKPAILGAIYPVTNRIDKPNDHAL